MNTASILKYNKTSLVRRFEATRSKLNIKPQPDDQDIKDLMETVLSPTNMRQDECEYWRIFRIDLLQHPKAVKELLDVPGPEPGYWLGGAFAGLYDELKERSARKRVGGLFQDGLYLRKDLWESSELSELTPTDHILELDHYVYLRPATVRIIKEDQPCDRCGMYGGSAHGDFSILEVAAESHFVHPFGSSEFFCSNDFRKRVIAVANRSFWWQRFSGLTREASALQICEKIQSTIIDCIASTI